MIQVSPDGRGFADEQTGTPFVPVGTNYSAVLDMVDYLGKPRRFVQLFGVDQETETDGVAEAEKYMKKLGDLGMNVLRIWMEPTDALPFGPRLDPEFIRKFDRFLDSCGENGIYVSVGMHMSAHPSGWKLHNFQPPHNQMLLEQLNLLGNRWGNDERIFSWTIVGEGQLPWYTKWLGQGWPTWLQFWYNDDLDALKDAWGRLSGVDFNSFDDAPVPPRNIGPCLGVDRVNYGRLDELPDDPWAGSTWRYDWRLYLEHVGASRVHKEVAVLRAAGAKQMMTVGANSWTFPNLPAGQMTLGYMPYFHLDSLDYLCQHNYPMPQCLPGGTGDPLDNDKAMQDWLASNEIMGRIYTSLGKPVMLEEWGWYGGGKSEFAGTELKYRTEEEQERYCDLMMQTSQNFYSGWMYWLHRDMPHDGDLTQCSGLFKADGTLKKWGRKYGEWATKLKANPPKLAPAKETVDLNMKRMMTDDRFHETWWHDMIESYAERGPLDFNHVFERKPMTDWPNDIRDLDIIDQGYDVWAH